MPDRLRLLAHLSLARVTLFAAGAALLVYGLVNAWRAQNVTTLVVAGAVMFVFALVFPRDWSELRLTWGDYSALVSRVQETLEEAATSTSEEELRGQIDQLRTDLESVRKQPLWPRRTVEAADVAGFGVPHVQRRPQRPSHGDRDTALEQTADAVLLRGRTTRRHD